MANPNLDLLITVAKALGLLREKVVFVGGCATALLLTNPAAITVRVTEDVDAIIEVASLAGYHALYPELAARGFVQTMEDNTPPFRWRYTAANGLRMQLDLVPVDERVLGFANRWYRQGFDHAVTATPASDITLRHLSAPYFVATKLEAFHDRGQKDVYQSHDLEDIITVIDGRAEVASEVASADAPVRTYIVTQIQELLRNPDFINALPGLVSVPIRASVVMQRIQQLANVY
jgi:predicted nucleotidyltransferase